MAKDWLGQEYKPGTKIIYGISSSGSVNLIIGEVIAINEDENGKIQNVKVQPLRGSRYKRHEARRYYIDTRTGKRMDPWTHDKTGESKHIAKSAHYVAKEDGAEARQGYSFKRKEYSFGGHTYMSTVGSSSKWGYWTEDGRCLGYKDVEYVPVQFKDYVEECHEPAPRPVTLTVTQNITVWTGDLPDEA